LGNRISAGVGRRSVADMAIRTAVASWRGSMSEGTGVMRTGKGGLTADYSAKSRYEEGTGSNPEEMIGAAHAGCFSMALSDQLTKAGYPPTEVDTGASVHLDMVNNMPTVTGVDLATIAAVPGIDDAQFQQIASMAKDGCPVSRLLAPGAQISLSARLA
jgi:osmotically inducible protein OsmC